MMQKLMSNSGRILSTSNIGNICEVIFHSVNVAIAVHV